MRSLSLSQGFQVKEGQTIDVYETNFKILGFSEHEINPKGWFLCQDDRVGKNVYLQPFTESNLVNGVCCFPEEVKKVARLIIKSIKNET